MTPSEFRERYPWRHGEAYANKDKFILHRWEGDNLAPGDKAYTDEECLNEIAKNNQWDEKPDFYDFAKYIKTLGWHGKVGY